MVSQVSAVRAVESDGFGSDFRHKSIESEVGPLQLGSGKEMHGTGALGLVTINPRVIGKPEVNLAANSC
jgi:hypothetical protein